MDWIIDDFIENFCFKKFNFGCDAAIVFMYTGCCGIAGLQQRKYEKEQWILELQTEIWIRFEQRLI